MFTIKSVPTNLDGHSGSAFIVLCHTPSHPAIDGRFSLRINRTSFQSGRLERFLDTIKESEKLCRSSRAVGGGNFIIIKRHKGIRCGCKAEKDDCRFLEHDDDDD